jgi:hypothetical protein
MARLSENPEKYRSTRGVAPPYYTGIRTLIDLLVRATILPQDFKQSGSLRDSGARQQQSQQREHRRQDDSSLSKQSGSGNLGSQLNTPYNLNIVIEAKDSEAIKQIIELLKFLRDQRTP